jgi:hypothetical protein
MIKYIAVEKITPDIPRAWGTGKNNIEAKLQCEIALREKLLKKLEGGCSVGFIDTSLYIIKEDEPNPAHDWPTYIKQAIKTGLESPTPYKVIPYKNGIGIKKIELIKS